MHRFLIPTCCLLVLAVAGCADPTQDKPKATVEPAAPDPSRSGAAERFVLSPDTSTIRFVGSKVTGSHEGGFNAFEGEILVTEGDPLRSTVDVTIDTRSIWSDNERLTSHLASDDFFAVETHPTAVFRSTEIQQEGEGHRIVGNLTLHGITKSIAFPAEITFAEGRVSATSEFALRRFDFDMKFPGRPDDLIRDDVLIQLDLVAHRAAEPGAGS